MAPDWETARRMVEIAESRGVRVMIHDNWRWQSWYREAGAMIARGDIGTPLAYGFRTRVSHGAGDEPYPKQAYFRQLQRFMIDEVLVHHIDTARFLFGDIASIYAAGARRNPHILAEDHVILTLRHSKGAMGWVESHSFLKHNDSTSTMDEATFEGDAGIDPHQRAGRNLVRRRASLAGFRSRIPWRQRLRNAGPLHRLPGKRAPV